jgi:hypothetical protein
MHFASGEADGSAKGQKKPAYERGGTHFGGFESFSSGLIANDYRRKPVGTAKALPVNENDL